MTAFFKKHSTLILMSLLITLLILAWIFPSAGLKLGIAFLLLSFLIVSWIAVEKQKQAHRKGQITRVIFIRNAVLEITGTGLIMLVAGLLGRYVAAIATQPIDNDVLRVIAGIMVGMVVGIGVGFLAKKTLRRLIDISPRG
jgi:positive regulator of sigma E activity